MDNKPAPEKSPVIADLLAQTLASLDSVPAEEKAEVMKEMAEDNAKAAAAKKAAEAAKTPQVSQVIPVPAIRLPDGRLMIPTFMKHVFLSTPPHQVVCGKCNKAVLAKEMATVKQLATGGEGWRHLSCMDTYIVKGA